MYANQCFSVGAIHFISFQRASTLSVLNTQSFRLQLWECALKAWLKNATVGNIITGSTFSKCSDFSIQVLVHKKRNVEQVLVAATRKHCPRLGSQYDRTNFLDWLGGGSEYSLIESPPCREASMSKVFTHAVPLTICAYAGTNRSLASSQ